MQDKLINPIIKPLINNALIDGQLIADVILDRWSINQKYAILILEHLHKNQQKLYIIKEDLDHLNTIIDKTSSPTKKRELMAVINSCFVPVKVTQDDLKYSCEYDFDNFRDALLFAVAINHKIDIVITANKELIEDIDSEHLKAFYPQFFYTNLKSLIENNSLTTIPYDDIYPDTPTKNEENILEIFDHTMKIISQFSRDIYAEKYESMISNTVDDFTNSEEIPEIGEWQIENWCCQIFQNSLNYAEITLYNSQKPQKVTKSKFGKGNICLLKQLLLEALQEVGINLDSDKISYHLKNTTVDINEDKIGIMKSVVVLMFNDKVYLGEHINIDTVKASFYAYVKALNNLINGIYLDGKPDLDEKEQARIVTSYIQQNYKKRERDFTNLVLPLQKLNLSQAFLEEANFSNCDLSESIFTKGMLSQCTFEKAKLAKVDLRATILRKTNLMNADLSGAKLDEAILDGANLTEANLTAASLTQTNLQGTSFKSATLNQADFHKAENFCQADFSGAQIEGIKLDADSRLYEHILSSPGVSPTDELQLRWLQVKLEELSKDAEEQTQPEPIKLETFKELVGKIKLSDEFIKQHTYFDPEQFSRVRLFREGYLTVFIICWYPGQETDVHSHGNDLEGFRVLEGNLTSRCGEKPQSKQLTDVKKLSVGQGNFLDRQFYHQLANDCEEKVISLNFCWNQPLDDAHWVPKTVVERKRSANSL